MHYRRCGNKPVRKGESSSSTRCSQKPYWSYEDIGAFLVFAVLLGPTIRLLVYLHWLPRFEIVKPSTAVQLGIVTFLSVVLYVILKLRYRRAVLVPLGWVVPSFPYAIVALLAGLVSGSAVLFHLRTANQDLSHVSIREVLVLGTIFGPILEESFFRGCLLPLLAQTTGKAAAVIITALAFALFHSPADARHWVSFTATGLMYGWLRLDSESTAASAIMHACYNLTLFFMA